MAQNRKFIGIKQDMEDELIRHIMEIRHLAHKYGIGVKEITLRGDIYLEPFEPSPKMILGIKIS